MSECEFPRIASSRGGANHEDRRATGGLENVRGARRGGPPGLKFLQTLRMTVSTARPADGRASGEEKEHGSLGLEDSV